MADERVSTSNVTGESSESTVDIHIKTLDSQLYDFRVDKNMLVSAFKERIAKDVGLPVGQQRLIFRGKVLKDELRLSEYHVDNGHTLHLVARQPTETQPSSGNSSSSTGTTTANSSNTEQNPNAAGARPRMAHVSHSVVVGSFGGGDPNVGGSRDISRVISAVLDSFGIGDASVTVPMQNMQFNRQAPQGNEARVNVNVPGQPGNTSQPGNPSQSVPHGVQIPVGAGVAVPTLAAPIPNSLNTLSEFMNRMEQALSQDGYQPNQPSNGAEQPPAVELPSSARGVPLPTALAVIMRHAQRLLSGPAVDSLSHTAGRLEEEENIMDPTVRTQIQSEAMQSGLAMQHLGALLLELGRTMLTLRIGQSPAESSVHAGPAVYISSSGPNPIMVQPFPLQTNSLFGGNPASINSAGFGPVGIGAVPRHINVHIHAGIGQRGTNVEPNQGEHTDGAINASAAAAEVNSQTRGVDDSTTSENQASAGQPEGGVIKVEVQPDTSGTDTISSSSGTKSTNDVEGASSSSSVIDGSGNASTIPLGLGLGGLQPKRRNRQTKPDVTSSSAPSVNPPTSNPASGQLDPSAIMNQVIASPALDGLLSGVSNQTGMGSPDVLRNMLGQLTQNPAMMNTVNQIAQQIDGNQDLSNMFAGMGGNSGGGGGGGGGFDLSSMMQQMMPMVVQAFGGGGGGGGSGANMFQSPPSMDRGRQPTPMNAVSSAPQTNFQDLVAKIEDHDSREEVFASVVEAAAHLNDNGVDADVLSDICFEEDLTHEFMEMLKRDVSRRVEDEGE